MNWQYVNYKFSNSVEKIEKNSLSDFDCIQINLFTTKIEKKLEDFIWNEMGNTYNRIYNE